jgi:hypothetical protein
MLLLLFLDFHFSLIFSLLSLSPHPGVFQRFGGPAQGPIMPHTAFYLCLHTLFLSLPSGSNPNFSLLMDSSLWIMFYLCVHPLGLALQPKFMWRHFFLASPLQIDTLLLYWNFFFSHAHAWACTCARGGVGKRYYFWLPISKSWVEIGSQFSANASPVQIIHAEINM